MKTASPGTFSVAPSAATSIPLQFQTAPRQEGGGRQSLLAVFSNGERAGQHADGENGVRITGFRFAGTQNFTAIGLPV
ncbi:MAG: hypothetical protein ABIT76_11220 [Chthoniobacterales bacterium]